VEEVKTNWGKYSEERKKKLRSVERRRKRDREIERDEFHLWSGWLLLNQLSTIHFIFFRRRRSLLDHFSSQAFAFPFFIPVRLAVEVLPFDRCRCALIDFDFPEIDTLVRRTISTRSFLGSP
jgi:hypothetical protein